MTNLFMVKLPALFTLRATPRNSTVSIPLCDGQYTLFLTDKLSDIHEKMCELKEVTLVESGIREGINVDWYFCLIKNSK